jgi:hypothetical protein
MKKEDDNEYRSGRRAPSPELIAKFRAVVGDNMP